MSNSKEQERREECRRDVRRFLAERSRLAHRLETIHRRLNVDNDYTEEEVTDAVVFLVSARQAQAEPDAMGSTLYYQITHEGTLAHERGR